MQREQFEAGHKAHTFCRQKILWNPSFSEGKLGGRVLGHSKSTSLAKIGQFQIAIMHRGNKRSSSG